MSTKAGQDIVVEAKLDKNEPKDIVEWVTNLIQSIVFQLNNGVPRLRWAARNVVPDKPRSGDIVYADGTNWNPGSGQGFYGYYAGAWHFLG